MPDSSIVRNQNMCFNARYTVTDSEGGFRFQFLCACCSSGYATGLIQADSIEAAFPLAEKEARLFFNGCDHCGKWVCDQHYNMEKALCTECAPLDATSEQHEYLKELKEKFTGAFSIQKT